MAFHGACSFVSLSATFELLDIVITNETVNNKTTTVYQLLFNNYVVIVINDIMSKSCEQRLITKGHIATHTNLILLFKLLFNLLKIQSRFVPKFLLLHYRLVFFYKLRNLHCMPTFKTECSSCLYYTAGKMVLIINELLM